jgi:hypothetical protein
VRNVAKYAGHTMRLREFLSSLVILVVVMDAAVVAHHSTAAYQTRTTTVKGAVVKKFAWQNPHCILAFDARDDRGRVTTWSVETGSPSALSRIGWNRNAIAVGATILVELYPAKNGAPVGRLARIRLADGHELLDSLYKDSPFDTVQKK